MRFRSDLPEGGGGANYLKLKDKESVIGIFRGEPYDFSVVWENKKPVEVAPETPGSKFRFRINFVVKEGASYVPKIFEQGKTVYETLSLLNADYDLEHTVIRITRQGDDMNTTYNILPLPTPVDQSTREVLKHLKLNDLKSKPSHNSPPPQDNTPWPDENPEIPF